MNESSIYIEHIPFALIVSLILFVLYSYYKLMQQQKGLIIKSLNSIPIKIVSDCESLEIVINELLSYNASYLGIDCEWRPNRKGQLKQNKVSMIQIATNKLIILIRLNKFKNIHKAFISSGLLSIFSNTDILKCGVGIYQDKKKLFNDYNMNILSCIELNHLYSKTYNNDNQQFIGLKKLSQIILNINMKYKFDDKSITLSDWATNSDLSEKQIIYAAEDALVSYQIFDKLIKENMKNYKNQNEYIDDICFGIIDLNKSFLNKQRKNNKENTKNNNKNKSNYSRFNESECLLYDNCSILKPNGDFLSWCRRKTLERYINKGYAERVNTTTIKLKFEPENFNKKPMIEVVLGFKKNQCAVCGEMQQKLMRYFVIPLLYRQYLPSKFNEEAWRRHDVLPLCKNCHFKSQIFNEKFKNKLCRKFNIKHYRSLDSKLIEKSKLMRSIKPLINQQIVKKIPNQKKIILLKNVAHHFQSKYDEIYQYKEEEKKNEQYVYFENLIKIKDDGGNEKFVDRMKKHYISYSSERINIGKNASENHSKNMIAAFSDDIVKFIKLWRQQFVDNMKPKYLPKYWNVDNTFFDLKK